VERYGAGGFRGIEIYGVTGADFEKGAIPNGIWFTLKHRGEGSLPQNLLIISDTGDGSYYCLELGKGEAPVFIYWPGIPARQQQHPETVAGDFGEFFLGKMRQQL
jgi:hypothetical protein